MTPNYDTDKIKEKTAFIPPLPLVSKLLNYDTDYNTTKLVKEILQIRFLYHLYIQLQESAPHGLL